VPARLDVFRLPHRPEDVSAGSPVERHVATSL
jgi:hypothetical protein